MIILELKSLIRRHYFLFTAIAVVILMVIVGGVKLLAPKQGGAGGGGAAGFAQGGGGGGGGAGPGAGGGGPGGQRPGGPGGGRGQMIAVTTMPVHRQNFADRIEVLGVAKGRQSVSITSKNAELITAVRFRDGDHVRAGQTLVDLQGTEQDAAIDQAQSVADLAKLNADRWNVLYQRGIAAKSSADQYNAVYEQAKASLAAAKARRQDRVIRAPFAGVVGLSDVAPGALISPGAVIATLDDTTIIRVDFDVPDRYLSQIKDGTPITAKTDSYPNANFDGTISKLDTRINERTRTIKARALLNNRDGRLKPGMLMRIGIQEGVRQTLVVPEAAVQFDDTTAYIFVISDRQPGQGGGAGGFGQGAGQGGPRQQGPGGAPGAGAPAGALKMATKRAVVVGGRDRGVIEIKQGVREGEVIVADGINRLQAVTPVRVVRAGQDGAAEGGGPRAAGQGQGASGGPRQQGPGGPGANPGGQRPPGAANWNGQRRPGGGAQNTSTGA
jgi:membrane fusion protein (multidrug efflux system)